MTTLDKLTYAGRRENLHDVMDHPRHEFVHADICDAAVSAPLVERSNIVVHFAAESHVDRSIDGAAPFIQTNFVGTFTMLEAAAAYWRTLDEADRKAFRFQHISTDEVFGSLAPVDQGGGKFVETTPYAPNSPYSASKAGSDHLVRAWHHTYGLPTLATNCSNNYGPYHFPEKLIPLMILNALEGKPLPVYEIPLQAGMSIGVLLICVELLMMLAILLFIRDQIRTPVIASFVHLDATHSKRKRLIAEREILSRDGEWIPAGAPDGLLLVNNSDMLRMWSNDRFRSAPHRVINGVAGAIGDGERDDERGDGDAHLPAALLQDHEEVGDAGDEERHGDERQIEARRTRRPMQ